MKFVVSLILNIALSGGLMFSINELSKSNQETAHLHLVVERNNEKLEKEIETLKSKIEIGNADASKISDMFAFHMRSHR